jgi:predicted DNA-binding protein
MSSDSKKRHYLTLEQKKMVIAIKQHNPNMSWADVGDAFHKKTKLVIPTSSLSSIWSKRDQIVNDPGTPNSTPTKSKTLSISNETIQRIKSLGEGTTINEATVIREAKQVAKEYRLEPSNFNFSMEWAKGILNGKADDELIRKTVSIRQKNSETKQTAKPKRIHLTLPKL